MRMICKCCLSGLWVLNLLILCHRNSEKWSKAAYRRSESISLSGAWQSRFSSVVRERGLRRLLGSGIGLLVYAVLFPVRRLLPKKSA